MSDSDDQKMSCEVTSPLGDDSKFCNDDWEPYLRSDNTHPEAEKVNVSLGLEESLDCGSLYPDNIDPRIFSNPQTPIVSASFSDGADLDNTPFPGDGVGAASDGWLTAKLNINAVDDTSEHSLSLYPDYGLVSTSAPYFNSVETSGVFSSTDYAYPNLAHYSQLHRRSISEPPDGLAHHHHTLPAHVQSGQYVTFHRAGHFLGEPKETQPQDETSMPLKSQPRSKPEKQDKLLLRQSQASSGRRRLGPTSVPRPAATLHSKSLSAQEIPMLPPQFGGSRASTPGPTSSPKTPRVSSAKKTSRALRSPTSDPHDEKKPVAVMLEVEELRQMIIEAVQQATKGIESIVVKAEKRKLTESDEDYEKEEGVAGKRCKLDH